MTEQFARVAEDKISRSVAARDAAKSLLDELELGQGQIINSILKAKRLARLLRDDDAQKWLDYEARGYPHSFNMKDLGSCEKYAVAGGRVSPDKKYYTQSLPELEAHLHADRQSVEAARLPAQISPSVSSSNPNEMVSLIMERTVSGVVKSVREMAEQTRMRLGNSSLVFNGLKSALHSYAADAAIALEFGDIAQSVFEDARGRVDTFVATVAPKAAEQLLAALERFNAGDAESLSHALTSCRRLLATIADALFPPRSGYRDSKGKERKVGVDEYKNRILAYVDEAGLSKSTSSILEGELNHLAVRLDAVYEKACKGVHADVTADEVRIVVVGMYMFLGELANVAAKKSYAGSESSGHSAALPK